MFAQSPARAYTCKLFTLTLIIFCSAALCGAATVDIHPGQDIPSTVAAHSAGTTYVIYPGTYRLQSHIVPKTGDTFIGQTACAPPQISCPAILSGARIIGPLATFNGANYEVTGQTQRGVIALANTVCEPGYKACNLPEDLFFDGVPYQRLSATSLPLIGPKQWWFDYSRHIIYFHDNPSGHKVETSVLDTAFESLANNVTVQNLTVTGFANPLQRAGVQPTNGNVNSSSSLNWVIKNCEFYNNHATGVRVAYGTQVLNSYLHDNGALGIAGGINSTKPSGIVLQGNTITRNNYAHIYPTSGSGGVKFGSAANVVLRGNTISDNAGTGVHFDAASVNPLIDGNVVANNSGGAGIAYEISLNGAVVRNNILLRNALPGQIPISTAVLGTYASSGVDAYCNVIEIPNTGQGGANGITVGASNRGYSNLPPYQYLMATGNNFSYNTVIWDSGAPGSVGYFQFDASHQPNFFANNPPPDHNSYHLSSLSATNFTYDNNNTQNNTRKTFSEYQAAGADVHGTADTNNKSGFPTVAITSPLDQSTFSNSVTVSATAADKSGISRVEFYLDWKLQTSVSGSPYSFSLSTAKTGTHTVTAMAYSNAGIRSCYAVTLTKK